MLVSVNFVEEQYYLSLLLRPQLGLTLCVELGGLNKFDNLLLGDACVHV